MAKKKERTVYTFKEPDWPNATLQDIHFFTNQEINEKVLHKALVEYSKTVFSKEEQKAIARVSPGRIVTPARYAYAALRGRKFTDEETEVLHSMTREIVEAAQSSKDDDYVAEEKPLAPVISIQDRMIDNLMNYIEQFEIIIDNRDTKTDLQKLVLGWEGLKRNHYAAMQRYFQSDFDEVKASLVDEELAEAYKPKDAKVLIKLYENFMAACEAGKLLTKQTVRKVRKPKEVEADKACEKIEFTKTDETTGMVSITPVSCWDSAEVWIYNTKTRKFGCYKADVGQTLRFKGKAITGFNPNTSLQKTMRKPEELKGIQSSSKAKLNKMFDSIKTKASELSPRISGDILFIKRY